VKTIAEIFYVSNHLQPFQEIIYKVLE